MNLNFDIKDILLNLPYSWATYGTFILFFMLFVSFIVIIALVGVYLEKRLNWDLFCFKLFCLNLCLAVVFTIGIIFIPNPIRDFVHEWKYDKFTAKFSIESIELRKEGKCYREEEKITHLGMGIEENKAKVIESSCRRHYSTITCGELSVIECFNQIEKKLEKEIAAQSPN